jgi:hypothetical protein
MKIGDWVTSYSKGYFQIERIVNIYVDESNSHLGKLENKKIGEVLSNPIVVLKKGFNSNLKPNLGWDTCALSYCKLVDNNVLQSIQDELDNNTIFIKKFNNYTIPPIKSLFNISIKSSVEIIEKLDLLKHKIHKGLTYKEIIQETQINNYISIPPNCTVQLINIDFEVNQEKRTIFRDINIF